LGSLHERPNRVRIVVGGYPYENICGADFLNGSAAVLNDNTGFRQKLNS
jgi:hypothetical protein